MSEPIIRTMWASSTEIQRGDGYLWLSSEARRTGSESHPVLVIHAPEMPQFKVGDRVLPKRSTEWGTVAAPPAWGGKQWFVPVRWKSSGFVWWEQASLLRSVEPPEPDPRATLVDALGEKAVAALDDYISRALGREE